MTDVPEWLVTDLQPSEIHHEPWRQYDGPCTCTGCARQAAPQEVVYTLHFDPPYEPYPGAPAYKNAGHYTGRARENRLEERLLEHEQGRGARITQVQREAGGTWRLASVEPGGADRERRLKQHSAARRCPICKTEAEAATHERWQQATSPQPESRVQPEPAARTRTGGRLMADIHPELAEARVRAEEVGAQWEAHPSAETGRENEAAANALLAAEVQYNHELPWSEPRVQPEPQPDSLIHPELDAELEPG